MIVPKGFRAREAAALQRSRRGLVAPEIRHQRHAAIADKIDDAIAAGQDLPPNSAPTLRTEPLPQPVVSTETVATETPEGDGEPTDANADSAPAAEVTEQVISDAKPAAKAKPNKKAGK